MDKLLSKNVQNRGYVLAQLARAVEYTDCISAKEKDPPTTQ